MSLGGRQVHNVGRPTRKERAKSQLLLIVLAVGLAALAAAQNDLLTTLWLGLFAVAAMSWLILDKLPTKCRMPTTRGTSCKRDTTGLLFGCKDHTWVKFFAWFGWRRHEPAQRSSNPSRQRAEPDPPEDAADSRRKRRDTILFRLTVSASC